MDCYLSCGGYRSYLTQNWKSESLSAAKRIYLGRTFDLFRGCILVCIFEIFTYESIVVNTAQTLACLQPCLLVACMGIRSWQNTCWRWRLRKYGRTDYCWIRSRSNKQTKHIIMVYIISCSTHNILILHILLILHAMYWLFSKLFSPWPDTCLKSRTARFLHPPELRACSGSLKRKHCSIKTPCVTKRVKKFSSIRHFFLEMKENQIETFSILHIMY